ADQRVDAVGQLCTGEAHEVRVVEKICQSEVAAWTGHLELLEENEGGPLRTVEPGFRHGCTSAFRSRARGSIPEVPPEEPLWLTLYGGVSSPLERTQHVESVVELQDDPAQAVLIVPAQERRLHAVVLVDDPDPSQ